MAAFLLCPEWLYTQGHRGLSIPSAKELEKGYLICVKSRLKGVQEATVPVRRKTKHFQIWNPSTQIKTIERIADFWSSHKFAHEQKYTSPFCSPDSRCIIQCTVPHNRTCRTQNSFPSVRSGLISRSGSSCIVINRLFLRARRWIPWASWCQ